jgi:DNA-binding response OmpR family regulator
MGSEVPVLIIDDDKTFCELLAETLDGAGIKAAWTTDGVDGYEMSLSCGFHVIVLDVQMPGVSGTELARDIKQKKPGTKIILISTFADERLRQIASQLGVGLLSKPFSASHLIEMIDKILSERNFRSN